MTVCDAAGASEMLMANAVTQLAAKTPGKEAIAIEAYARALRMVWMHCIFISGFGLVALNMFIESWLLQSSLSLTVIVFGPAN